MPDIRAKCRQYTMDSPAGWCTIAHCEQQDTLPEKGECFIHRASDVTSKQP